MRQVFFNVHVYAKQKIKLTWANLEIYGIPAILRKTCEYENNRKFM